MIIFKEVDNSYFELYDKVSMNVDVRSEYTVKRINNGLGGLILEETMVQPYRKDLSVYARAAEYEKDFDLTNWRYYMAFEGDVPVGAMTVAGKTPGMNMLSGRETPVYYGIFALTMPANGMGSGKIYCIWEYQVPGMTDIIR